MLMLQIKFETKFGLSSAKLNSILELWSKSQNSSLKKTFLKSKNAPHWHISKDGTIEVTSFKKKRILLVAVRKNREGKLAGKSCRKLAYFLQNKLNLQIFKENRRERYRCTDW